MVDGLHLGEVRCQQRHQGRVDDDDLVLGVVGDVDQLVGGQPDVEGVQHRAHGRDGQIGLEVLGVVPHEGADALVAGDAQGAQRIGQPGDTGAQLAVRQPAAAVVGGGHHLGVPVHRRAVAGDRADRQGDVLHGAAHRVPPWVVCCRACPTDAGESSPGPVPRVTRMRPRRLRDLDGLNVFVTGAASGIGRAVAEAVASGGGRLFLTDVNGDRAR